MGGVGDEEMQQWQEEEPVVAQATGGERIRVWIRLRPLNEKEIARNEVSDWECIDDRTIMFRNSLPERAMFPDPPRAYSFDRVFRPDYTTWKMYEEAAKHVALSVISGINATIFAYGQTSSGKTFTMNGITEYTVTDVYDYIQRHQERAFVLKFSAMEIYNEAIRDLLNPEGIQLRVLDDPERGTVVEKLTEEVMRDLNHMKELLSICDAQRQVGETSLNETSSRSHQILRLTIESSAREFLGKDNSSTLSASVNFVDLAGSERASQMISSGTRLKEGCHINRSLLTLGTVIRKLSNGRNTHIPYRESKLTRILQPSLGGNARTAIICTMCPSRSHLEQSKNTLLFATCAKEVATHAQVNVVMSDKALVKHLQKELARLESELRSPHSTASSHYETLLRTKNAQIQKMEKEIKELTQERDLAQSRLKDLLCVVGDEQASKSLNGFEDESSMLGSSSMGGHSFHFENVLINQSNRDLQLSQNKFFVSGGKYADESCRDVKCVEVEKLNQSEQNPSNSWYPEETNEEYLPVRAMPDPIVAYELTSLNNMVEGNLPHDDDTRSMYAALERQLQGVQRTLDDMDKLHQDKPSMHPQSRLHDLHEASHSSRFYSSSRENPDSNMHTAPSIKYNSDFSSKPKSMRQRPRLLTFASDDEKLPRADSQSSMLDNASEILEGESVIGFSEDNYTSIQSFVAGLKEMAQLQYEQQLNDDQKTEMESSRRNVSVDPFEADTESPSHWPSKFQRQLREIIMLWHECNVSLVHRTYFFMLFRGDPADSIYVEVELRRLAFLKTSLFQGNCVRTEGINITIASSMRALRRERVMLSKQMQKRLSYEEREKLYQKWGIGLNSKRRKLQLARSLWSGTSDMDHISESAFVIANLVGLSEQGQVLKEMFGLSFSPQTTRRRSFGWKNGRSSLL